MSASSGRSTVSTRDSADQRRPKSDTAEQMSRTFALFTMKLSSTTAKPSTPCRSTRSTGSARALPPDRYWIRVCAAAQNRQGNGQPRENITCAMARSVPPRRSFMIKSSAGSRWRADGGRASMSRISGRTGVRAGAGEAWQSATPRRGRSGPEKFGIRHNLPGSGSLSILCTA
jgi:hypothetical protein